VEEEQVDPLVNPTTLATRVCSRSNESGVEYLVIGGIACVLHGYVRATTDVDILIERSTENAERLLEALRGLGWGSPRSGTPRRFWRARSR
jgi:hypothetical protein